MAVKLSYRLKRQMTDTDRLIEKKQGKSIREIFEQGRRRSVPADGDTDASGIEGNSEESGNFRRRRNPVREENRTLMKEIGKVVYLRAKAETLYERLKKIPTDPLLQGGDEDLKTKIQGLL